MKALLASLFLLLSISVQAQTSQTNAFFDWLEAGDARYELLRRGVEQVNAKGWVAERIQKDQPIPQASARELVEQIADSPSASPSLVEELRKKLPLETVQTDWEAILAKSEAQIQRLNVLDHLADQIPAIKEKNNYSALSTPKGQFQVSAFFYNGAFHQEASQEYANIGPAQYGMLVNLYLNGKVGEASWEFNGASFINAPSAGAYRATPNFRGMFNPTTNGWYPGVEGPEWTTFNNFFYAGGTSSLAFHFDPVWFPDINLKFGYDYLRFDDLLYTSPAIPIDQPFFANTVLNSEQAELFAVTRPFQGFQFQKAGSTGWWIFSNTKFLYSPAMAIPTGTLGQEHTSQDLVAAKLELRGFDLGLLEDMNWWGTWVQTWTPQYYLAALEQSDRDFALGFTSGVLGGGLLTAEWAFTNWYSQGPQPSAPWGPSNISLLPQDINWQDQAVNLILTKPVYNFSFTLQASYFGPYFITGPRAGLWNNSPEADQNGNYHDMTVADPRPGKAGGISWQTQDYDFAWLSNNSQRLYLQSSWSNIWATLGFSTGFATQNQPSGPWITTSTFLNNSASNSPDWYRVYGSWGYIAPTAGLPADPLQQPLWRYDQPTLAPAYYHGQQVSIDYFGSSSSKWNWQDLEPLGSGDKLIEYLVLSRNGVGDANLREDSIKTLNDMKLTTKFDFQALLRSELPFNLQGYLDLRDLDESIHLAMLADTTLLREAVTEWFLTYGLLEEVNLLGYGAYETWYSRAGYFPLDTQDISAGIGFDFLMNRYLSGLVVGARFKWMAHVDQDIPLRDLNGYSLNAGATVTY